MTTARFGTKPKRSRAAASSGFAAAGAVASVRFAKCGDAAIDGWLTLGEIIGENPLLKLRKLFGRSIDKVTLVQRSCRRPRSTPSVDGRLGFPRSGRLLPAWPCKSPRQRCARSAGKESPRAENRAFP